MEFIEKYARVDEVEHDDVAGCDEVNQLDLDFIDDETDFKDQESTDYRLMNVTRDLQDAIADRPMALDLDSATADPENFVLDFLDEVSYEFDEFFGFEKCIRKVDEEFKIFERESKDSFYFSLLNAIYYHLLEKKEDFDFSQDEERLREVLGRNFSENLKLKKYSLQLDLSLSTFETQCHLFNDLLMEKNLLLRVYEFRKKFCYLIKKIPRGKNTVQRELSACVEEHFNGFNLVKRLTENSIRQLYKLIDIVCKPISDINQIINCFFAVSMRNPTEWFPKKQKKAYL